MSSSWSGPSTWRMIVCLMLQETPAEIWLQWNLPSTMSIWSYSREAPGFWGQCDYVHYTQNISAASMSTAEKLLWSVASSLCYTTHARTHTCTHAHINWQAEASSVQYKWHCTLSVRMTHSYRNARHQHMWNTMRKHYGHTTGTAKYPHTCLSVLYFSVVNDAVNC